QTATPPEAARPPGRRLARVAWLLDSSIPLPFTKFHIGIDALLGLIPGIGDLLGVIMSSFIVREAARLGAPSALLTRMAFNVALEGVVGIVPIVGDIFDAAWKANKRNVALLDAHLENPQRSARSSRWFVTLLMLGLIAFMVILAATAFVVVRALVSAFQG
ncbi:MAG: DUF4112 domain-containing protein, partial [Pseudomonadota bacterium]